MEHTTQMHKVTSQVHDVRNIMLENIDAVLSRGEKMETIEITANDLRHQSNVFQQRSGTLYCAQLQKNWCLAVVIIVMGRGSGLRFGRKFTVGVYTDTRPRPNYNRGIKSPQLILL